MDENEYLEKRLDDQIDWYDKKSVYSQKWFKRLQVVAIVGAAIIPFLSGYMSEEYICMKIAIGFLGLIVAAVTAILGLYQFQENWIEYRTTCESLKHEKYVYLTKTTPYDDKNALALLVERVETLISKENTNWTRQTKSYKEKGAESGQWKK